MESPPPAAGRRIVVEVGGLLVASAPDILVTRALGSCVAVTAWDPETGVGGMAHVLVPTVVAGASRADPRRVAALAVPLLVGEIEAREARREHLSVKLAGGAAMFSSDPRVESIGSRNLVEVRRQFELLGIPVAAEDVGGSHARAVELDLRTGALLVRSHAFGELEI